MLIVNGHDMVSNGLQWSERPSCLVLFSIAVDGWTYGWIGWVDTGHMDGHMIILSRPVIHWMGGHMQPGIITSASLGTFRAPTTGER